MCRFYNINKNVDTLLSENHLKPKQTVMCSKWYWQATIRNEALNAMVRQRLVCALCLWSCL